MKRILTVFLAVAFALLPSFALSGTTAFDLVISAGTPQIGSGDYTTTGNVYFVDSGHASRANSADRGTYDKPFSTLDYAVGRCTANNGDIIFLAPGHAENLALADAVDVDTAGVRIVGLGEGNNRPTFTYTGTAGEFVIGAADVTVENLRFVAGISNVTMGISVEAGGDRFTLRNCEVPEPVTATFDFADIIDLASGADDILIDGMLVRQVGVTAGDLDHFLELGTGVNNRVRVINSLIEGEFAVSAIWSNTADTEVLIDNCIITNATNGEHAIEFTSTARGEIRNTLVRTDAQGTAVNPGSLTMSEVLWDDNDVADSVSIPVVAGGESTQALTDVHLDHFLALDGATQKYPEQAVQDSMLCKILGDDDPAVCTTYDNATDSLEALGNVVASLDAQINVTEATGEADIDISEADYTGYINIMTVTSAAGGLMDLRIDLDVNKATTGWDTISTAADTIDITLVGQVDGTNYRTISNATQITANGDGSLENSESGVSFHVGPLGPNESLQVHVKLSVERDDAELPYRVAYIGAAPTITPVAIP